MGWPSSCDHKTLPSTAFTAATRPLKSPTTATSPSTAGVARTRAPSAATRPEPRSVRRRRAALRRRCPRAGGRPRGRGTRTRARACAARRTFPCARRGPRAPPRPCCPWRPRTTRSSCGERRGAHHLAELDAVEHPAVDARRRPRPRRRRCRAAGAAEQGRRRLERRGELRLVDQAAAGPVEEHEPAVGRGDDREVLGEQRLGHHRAESRLPEQAQAGQGLGRGGPRADPGGRAAEEGPGRGPGRFEGGRACQGALGFRSGGVSRRLPARRGPRGRPGASRSKPPRAGDRRAASSRPAMSPWRADEGARRGQEGHRPRVPGRGRRRRGGADRRRPSRCGRARCREIGAGVWAWARASSAARARPRANTWSSGSFEVKLRVARRR